MSRAEERAGIDTPSRFRLIEGDMDRLERALADGIAQVEARLAKIMWALVGLLISVCVSCIVFVATATAGP